MLLTLEPIFKIIVMTIFIGPYLLYLLPIEHTLVIVSRLLHPNNSIFPIIVNSPMLLCNLRGLTFKLGKLLLHVRLERHVLLLLLGAGEARGGEAADLHLKDRLFLL